MLRHVFIALFLGVLLDFAAEASRLLRARSAYSAR